MRAVGATETSDLNKRMAEYLQGLFDGFTCTHGIKFLVYYEMDETMDAALWRFPLSPKRSVMGRARFHHFSCQHS